MAVKTTNKLKPGVLMRANYTDILLLNFEIDPEAFKSYLPPGLSIAKYNDTAFVSLIAMKTRRLSYGNFILPMASYPSLGLRFYVERIVDGQPRKGVYYIRNYVSRKSVAAVHNWLFQSAPHVMKIKAESSGFHENDSAVMPSASYQWEVNSCPNRVRVSGHSILRIGTKHTKEKFVLDFHYLYYQRNNELVECYADHPPWVTWGAASGTFDVDVEALFGRDFVKPLKRRAASVFLARGSDVVIHRPVAV